MNRDRGWFLKQYPTAFHVTYTPNIESIKQNGFFSANALYSDAGVKASHRADECVLPHAKFGNVILRDQQPMNAGVLRRCLRDFSPPQWYELIDDHIFFSLREQEVQKLVGKYSNQTVLEVPMIDILRAAEGHVYLTPINTGAVAPAYATRGSNTFHVFDDWCARGFVDRMRSKQRNPVELAVRHKHLNVNGFIKVRHPHE